MQYPASHSASASPRTSIVEDLFVDALAVPEAERAQLFAARNATDEERAAARRMLAAYESSAGRVDAAMGALRQVASETASSLVTKLTGRADGAAVDAAVGRALVARQG